jgi:cytidylate kinase
MAVITISREFGAGGRTLGEGLCGRFGFRLVDEHVIDELARRSKVSVEWLTAIEKEASSPLLGLISSIFSQGSRYLTPSSPGEGFERKKYIAFLSHTMTAMAVEGGYALLGRGSQLVLKGHPKAFHVLLVAEYEDRLRFMMEHYQLDEEQATKTIKEKERQREAVGTKIFEADINDPKLYHMILNTSRIPIDWAVDSVGDLFSRFMKKLDES